MNPQEQSLVAQYVALELRGNADAEQLRYLHERRPLWLAELIRLKRKTETQMTSSKTRAFEINCRLVRGEIDLATRDEQQLDEMKWRTNANRFLQQIEGQIATLKNYDYYLREAQEH